MDLTLKGKRALVTGAASGIGQAIAAGLASEGASVAVHARSKERAEETIDRIKTAGGKAFPVAADLQNSDAIRSMCEEALETLGGIDIVVSNAGVADIRSVVEMDEEFWDWTIDIGPVFS